MVGNHHFHPLKHDWLSGTRCIPIKEAWKSPNIHPSIKHSWMTPSHYIKRWLFHQKPRTLVEMILFESYFFQIGWFNHRLRLSRDETKIPPKPLRTRASVIGFFQGHLALPKQLGWRPAFLERGRLCCLVVF